MRPALGHVYTITRHLGDRLRPPEAPRGEPWTRVVRDDQLGDVKLTGVLHRGGDDAPFLILVHGLGGSIESGYMRRMAQLATARGYAVLRLNLRGADRSGVDIYHAGLTDDLRATLQCPEVVAAPWRAVVGYSLGGHMSLRFAGESRGVLDAVVAVCSPLDLSAGARFIDSRRRRIYCRHLLRGLREIYAQSAPSIGDIVGTTVAQSREIRTIREWDERIVARRFGFSSAEDYYAKATAIPLLSSITTPTLLVRATHDPMVSPAAASLERARGHEVWHVAGGHVGFPKRAEIEERILGWLDAKIG